MRVLVVFLALCSCSKARPIQGEPANPVSWEEEIGPLFAANCNSCHSGDHAQAGYRTTSYLEALGPTSNPVAVAGDPGSKILGVLDPAHADAIHQTVKVAFDPTRAWVVDGQLSFFRSGIHPGGILNPNDPQFHKYLVRDAGWNFAQCQHCHGDDLAGGKAGVSCQECHGFQVPAGGAPTCVSCHGNVASQSPAPPRDLSGGSSTSSAGVGAHQAHLFGRFNISSRIQCTECHVVPAQIGNTPGGHLDHLRPAIVTFSGRAVADSAQPVWNGASCSATYCHGGGAKLSTDTRAQVRNPAWTGTNQTFCGSCHGTPPSTPPHAGISYPDCARCHAKSVTAGGAIIVTGTPDAPVSTHLNGVVDVDVP
jgi:predicted CxxxxCH...CXXCH cytochrome family protein